MYQRWLSLLLFGVLQGYVLVSTLHTAPEAGAVDTLSVRHTGNGGTE